MRWVFAAKGLYVFSLIAMFTVCLTDGEFLMAQPSATPATTRSGIQDEMDVLIAKALDQPASLAVSETPIQKALEQLSENSGVAIRLASGTTSFLPYGAQTNLTATIEKRPLREILSALLLPLGLEYAAATDHVLVQATPPLKRMARRATWEDLDLLGKLAAKPWSKELFESLKFQFQDSPPGSVESNRETLGQLASAVGDGSAVEVLEHACLQHGWTWYPSATVIVIRTLAKQIEQQLEQRVSLRYVQTNIKEALLDLANRADVLLRFDPGVLAKLPSQTTEHFSLSIENATIRQALEIIGGETGLTYVIEPNGIRFTAHAASPTSNIATTGTSITAQAEVTAQATAAALRSNSVIGQITFPMADGTSVSFFVRQTDLPPEVNEMRKDKINQAVNQLRKHLHSEQSQD